MRLKLLAGAAGLLSSVCAFGADFEYHGYMRSGIGFSRGGTDQVCFRAPGTEGASGKHRLGNECDTYIEASFKKLHLLGSGKTGPSFSTQLTFSLASSGHRDWEPTTAEVDSNTGTITQASLLSLREAYVSADNVVMGNPWIGKRFYRRQDIHMLDYYLIDNSGPGAGVENLMIGPGKLHVAVIHNIPAAESADGPAQTNIDVRYSDIAAFGGTLEGVLIHGRSGERGHSSGEKKWEALNGTQVALVRRTSDDTASNTLTLQYGNGIFGGNPAWGQSMLNQHGAFGSQMIAKDDSDARDARNKSSTLRLANQYMDTWDQLTCSVVLLYQSVNFGGAELNGEKIPAKQELTFGWRPVYSMGEYSSLAFELGHTNVKNAIQPAAGETEWKNASLNKFTLAPQVSAGKGYWARPTLRVFATYASWNEDAKGQVGGPVYAGDQNGFSTGAQLEAWW